MRIATLAVATVSRATSLTTEVVLREWSTVEGLSLTEAIAAVDTILVIAEALINVALFGG